MITFQSLLSSVSAARFDAQQLNFQISQENVCRQSYLKPEGNEPWLKFPRGNYTFQN
jgi:hypothetical protein